MWLPPRQMRLANAIPRLCLRWHHSVQLLSPPNVRSGMHPTCRWLLKRSQKLGLSQVCSGLSEGCGASGRTALLTSPAARASNPKATPTPTAAPARTASGAAQSMPTHAYAVGQAWPPPLASSKAPGGTWSRTAWTSPALAGPGRRRGVPRGPRSHLQRRLRRPLATVTRSQRRSHPGK